MARGACLIVTTTLWMAMALGQTTPEPMLIDPGLVPGAGLAAEGGPGTLWVNPANLAYDPDPGWGVFFRYGPDDRSPFSGGAAARVGGLSGGLRWFEREGSNPDFSIDLAAGVQLPKRIAIGLSAHWWLLAAKRNILAFDASAAWRPLPWLGMTVLTRNIGDPGSRTDGIPQTGVGLAIRPLGRGVVFGVDYLHSFLDADSTDVFAFNARIRPTRGLFLRAAVDSRLEFGAGLELYFGGRGFGLWTGTRDDAGIPDVMGWVASDERDEHVAPPHNRVDAIDLTTEPEYLPVRRLLSPSDLSWWEALDQFARAAEAPGVRGVYLTLGGADMSWARWQELRSAIGRTRAAGKDVIVELVGAVGNGALYAASGATEVLAHPAATLDLTGVSTENFYLGGALESFGVDVDVVRRSAFKSAGEMYTEREPSPADRLQEDALLDDRYDALVQGIADGRARTTDDVKAWIDGGPYTAEEAVALGLVDARAYPDQARAKLDERYKMDIRTVDLSRRPRARTGWEPPEQITVVYVEGAITSGPSRHGGLLPVNTAGSETIVAQLDRVAKDAETRAVVLRVDSPGGSSFGSDEIWRAIERVKAAGKPVVVSMGGVAASGGYYISAGADAIWAEPTTITGSIGVIAMKPTLAGLLDRVGITTWRDQRGRNAGMSSPLFPWDPVQRARMEAIVGADYETFKDRVATGRGMTVEQVEAIAQGRIWSGTDAKEHHLIDELGGLPEAIQDARRLAGIPDKREVEVIGLRDRRRISDVLLPDLSLIPMQMAHLRIERAMANLAAGGFTAGMPIQPLQGLLWLSSQDEVLWRLDPQLLKAMNTR